VESDWMAFLSVGNVCRNNNTLKGKQSTHAQICAKLYTTTTTTKTTTAACSVT
jgi:hypothetical protein